MKNFIILLTLVCAFQSQLYAQSKYSGGTGDGFSSGTATWSAPLPITLTSFTAALQNEMVNLNWMTIMEHHCDSFSIQYSDDGKNWNILGQLKANGESNFPISYSLVDPQSFQGIRIYRLFETDIQGKTHLIASPQSKRSGESLFQFLAIPNPARENFTLQCIAFPTDLSIPIILFDAQGRMVNSLQVKVNQPISTQNIPNGIYHIILPNNQAVKLIILHDN